MSNETNIKETPSQERDRLRQQAIIEKQLKQFARDVDKPSAAVPLNRKPQDHVRREFQELKSPEIRNERPKIPDPVATLPTVIVVNGEFKIVQFHFSGGLADLPF